MRTKTQKINAATKLLKETDDILQRWDIVKDGDALEVFYKDDECFFSPDSVIDIARAFSLSVYCKYDNERKQVGIRII